MEKALHQNTASSSLGSVSDEILEESEMETGPVSTSSALVQVQTYLTEQPSQGQMIYYITPNISKCHTISPHWLLLHPSFSVPPAQWTVRDSFLRSQTSL